VYDRIAQLMKLIYLLVKVFVHNPNNYLLENNILDNYFHYHILVPSLVMRCSRQINILVDNLLYQMRVQVSAKNLFYFRTFSNRFLSFFGHKLMHCFYYLQ